METRGFEPLTYTLRARDAVPTPSVLFTKRVLVSAGAIREQQNKKLGFVNQVCGGDKGIRTPDLYVANVSRYQLCYAPVFTLLMHYTTTIRRLQAFASKKFAVDKARCN